MVMTWRWFMKLAQFTAQKKEFPKHMIDEIIHFLGD